MQTSQRGIDLIKQFEGLRLEAYDDGVGVQTVGYGHTKGVTRGMKITAAQAVDFLRQDLRDAELEIERSVSVDLCQHQFDALASLIFNIGGRAFRDSTLRKKLNACDQKGAAAEFDRWVYAAGKKLTGLVRRRAAERKLFEDKP
ncbi:lysozyme [Pseudomonas sp. Marseille-QA0892]